MKRPFAAAFLAVNAVWTSALLASPFLLPAGTVRGLDGTAHLMDYSDLWKPLPRIPGIIYALGDLICHQRETRSFLAHGNQFPVDARLLAAFLASNAGLGVALLAPGLVAGAKEDEQAASSFLKSRPWPNGIRRHASLLLLATALGPTAVDGVLEGFTNYESSNGIRTLTGALLGFGGALWIALLLDDLARPTLAPAATALPERHEQTREPSPPRYG